ncbi:UNVERIFIED_CONTAM: hypothetical protein Slati_4484800 [Sesamum latifolium]|uniref:Reverse transcriptase zinc-binding domain-containing protein n=1 Tax=Sesamum latifolium TaxID=2727402 RepID=A0AAW2SUE3_9LAMI
MTKEIEANTNSPHQTKINMFNGVLTDITRQPPPSAMSLLVWNCQGLGNSYTVKGLKDLRRDNKPTLVFLTETKCFESQIEAFEKKFDLFGCSVDPKGRSGGLALFWQKSVEVQLQSFSRPHPDDIQQGVKHLSTVVDEVMAADLQLPFTEDGVWKALSCISPLKSPDLDGTQFSSVTPRGDSGESSVYRISSGILAAYRHDSGQEINFLKSSVAFSQSTPPNVQSTWLISWLVVQAIPSYAISCFRLLKTLLKEFQSLVTDFFWHDGDRRCIHWIAWDKLCCSKLEGGLGFRDLEVFNLTLLAKQLWYILMRPECLVSKIPRSLSSEPDIVIWHYSNNGLFSVRSAYHLALSFASPAGTSDGHLRSRKLWRIIWQAKVLNKIKVFTWRAIRNALPTALNLKKKLPHEEIDCPFCTATDETIFHTLLGCSFARQVWVLSNICWYFLCYPAFFIEEWFLNISDKLSSGDFDCALMICCTIWWSRNLKSLNKSFLFPQQIVDFARSYLFAFVVQNSAQLPPRPVQHHLWEALQEDRIKINFDGALLEEGNSLGLGMVTQNPPGVCLAWLSICINRRGPALLVETFAARTATLLACQRSWQKVTIEGDCATLISKHSLGLSHRSAFGPLVLDIAGFANQLESVSFPFVFRSGNSIAHALVQLALNLEGTLLVPLR